MIVKVSDHVWQHPRPRRKYMIKSSLVLDIFRLKRDSFLKQKNPYENQL